MIDPAAVFPCLSSADSAVLQLTAERKLGDNLTQDMCLCPKISQAGKLRAIENYFQSFLSQDKSDYCISLRIILVFWLNYSEQKSLQFNLEQELPCTVSVVLSYTEAVMCCKLGNWLIWCHKCHWEAVASLALRELWNFLTPVLSCASGNRNFSHWNAFSVKYKLYACGTFIGDCVIMLS